MPDSSTLIAVSAFSGLAGALLTQLMTGLFNYYGDKRKYRMEVKNAYRNKKIEIGENFYYLNGETMALLKKSIAYWKKRNKFSAQNMDYITKDIKRTEEQIVKIYAENWKYNLVNLYFDVKLSIDEINEENQKSHILYFKVREITEKIMDSVDEDKDLLYGQYSFCTYDLISQYESVYKMLEQDMNTVKDELLKDFTRP